MVTTCTTFRTYFSPRCPLPAHGVKMYHFLVIFATSVSLTCPWRQYAPLFGYFCHCGVLYQPMVTTCTTFSSFLSPRCPLPAHGYKMHHFLVIFVTAVPLTIPRLQNVPLFGHFSHRGVPYQPMVTTCTTFGFFVTAVCSSSPW